MRHPLSPFRRHALALAALLCIASSRGAVGQLPAVAPSPDLTVYLLTAGQGDLVWEKFGHNAIWIHDPATGTDRVYNYGLFDFNSPGYWGRFLKGTWIYQLGVAEIDQFMYLYRATNRSVWVQELNLTPARKTELQAFLEWNALPENREYRYDYFRDNCSTRVRDALDRATGGALRRATADSLTDKTFRWHSRRLIAEDRVSYTGMHAGLGPAADRPITAWQEMFVPMEVQKQVQRIRVRDSAGVLVPLVASERQIFSAIGRPPERMAPPRWTGWFLLIGATVGGGLAALARTAQRAAVARFAFAALSSVWALLTGVGGVLLVLLWTLTDHTAAHANHNLLQFDPLALPLVVLLPALGYGVRRAARPALWLAGAVAALSLLGLLLKVVPGWYQVNGEIIALMLPAHLGMLAAAYGLARAPTPLESAPATPSRGRTDLRHEKV